MSALLENDDVDGLGLLSSTGIFGREQEVVKEGESLASGSSEKQFLQSCFLFDLNSSSNVGNVNLSLGTVNQRHLFTLPGSEVVD